MKKWMNVTTIFCILIGLVVASVYAVPRLSNHTQPVQKTQKFAEAAQNKDKVIVPKDVFFLETKGVKGESTTKKNPAYVLVNNHMFVRLTEVLTMIGFKDIKVDSKTNEMTAVRKMNGEVVTFQHVVGSKQIMFNKNQTTLAQESRYVNGKVYASLQIYEILARYIA